MDVAGTFKTDEYKIGYIRTVLLQLCAAGFTAVSSS